MGHDDERERGDGPLLPPAPGWRPASLVGRWVPATPRPAPRAVAPMPPLGAGWPGRPPGDRAGLPGQTWGSPGGRTASTRDDADAGRDRRRPSKRERREQRARAREQDLAAAAGRAGEATAWADDREGKDGPPRARRGGGPTKPRRAERRRPGRKG